MISGRLHGSRCKVTAQTVLVVRTRIAHKRLVRVVASHTSQAGVPFRSPTPAFFQAIRLGAHVGDPCKVLELDVPPGAMARAAEVGGVGRLELAGIED
jgi:hypothetical protein